jgi:glycosyltransferase involved in cell wall biosynthesis
MSAPLVTVGIATFNAAGTVERAILSALRQSWRPLEIVVVDDCSSDGTVAIVRGLAACHPELRSFTNVLNSGVATTRNRILAEAYGSFVAFFDDDDESLSDRVAEQVRRILDYERDYAAGQPVVCHTARRQLYPDGREGIALTMGQSEGRAAPHGLPVAERILLGAPLEEGYGACPTCSQMARLETYRALGGFDPQFRRSEDTDFNVRLARAGGHFVGIAKPMVTQTMSRRSDKTLAEELRYMLMLLDKHRDILDDASLYRFCRKWIKGKYALLEGRWATFLLSLGLLFARYPIATTRRLHMTLPNLALNRAFSRLHRWNREAP